MTDRRTFRRHYLMFDNPIGGVYAYSPIRGEVHCGGYGSYSAWIALDLRRVGEMRIAGRIGAARDLLAYVRRIRGERELFCPSAPV